MLYKGILRKCRKYFQNRFLAETGHVKYRKSKPKRYASLKENLKRFCEENFQGSEEEMDFYLGCFIYPNEMQKVLENDGASQKKLALVDSIHSVLYKYTHKKLNFMCKTPALATLLSTYLATAPMGEAEEEILAKCRATLQ